jgi:hypothetical protein
MNKNQTRTNCPSRFAATPAKLIVAALLLWGLFQPACSRAATFSLVLSNKWTLAPGSTPILPTGGGNPRSLAINRVTGNVLVPSLVNSNHIEVFSGANGADLGGLSTGGTGSGIISGGTLALLGIGVSDDGVIYACNLDNAANVFKIYRWASEDLSGATQPTIAFGGSSGATPGTVTTRCGDSFFVRGAGTKTQIIASGTGSTNFTIFTTADGTNFTANQIPIPTVPGSGGLNRTVAFDGTNNAFWGGKPNDTALYYVTFNLSGLTATTVSNISFSPPMGMCAVSATNGLRILAGIVDDGFSGSSSRSLLVYDLSNLSSPAQGGSVAFGAGGSADGNITGQADIAAGMVAALSTQGGIVALNIALQSNTPPGIVTAPIGTSGTFPPYTLSVGASGTQPLHYQWLASNNGTSVSTTFTNILSATNAGYVFTGGTTNYFEVIVTNAFGSVTSTPVLVSLLPAVTSTVVTQLWKVAAGANGYPYLSPTDNNARGLGYDTNSQRLVVASRTGGNGLYILDANTGTNIGTLSLTGVAFGGLLGGVDQSVIADDGAVYAGNLIGNYSTDGNFNLYQWPSPTNGATASVAFAGDPGNGSIDRWGDTMAVRGKGTNTQILLGSRNGTNVALLTTADGFAFTSTAIAVSNAPGGFAANGITFGVSNTLWGKAYGGHLYEVAYDPAAGTGGVLLDYPNPSKTPSAMVGVGVDPVRNILAGIDLGDAPNDLKLFQLTGSSDAPVLFNQAFFSSANANGNENVAIAMKYPRVYGLDVNNGIIGMTYGVPPVTAPTITTPPASRIVYTNDAAVTLSVSVSGSLPLFYQWRSYGVSTNNPPANIPNATNGTYVLSYPPVSASGYYDVVVHNVAGSATSAPPTLLTVITPVSIATTQLWTLPGGSRSYLDGSTYNTRGLAYDTNTATVLVCDHNNIYVLSATNGSDLFQLNVLGVYNGGFNNWVFDQIGVADDGAVYGANLYGSGLGGAGYSITRWDAVSLSANFNQAYGPADPSGSGDRWGDTMAVRGAGVNTEILIGSYGGTTVVLFTTTDGQTFTANPISVAGVPAGFSGQGIAFGAGDTFWAKSPGYDLRQVSFNRGTWTGTVTQDFVAGTQFPSAFDGIGVDVAANILGGVNFGDIPDDLQLYLLSGNSAPPTLFAQAFFGSDNINSQLNAATTLKGGKGFSLDVNNGLVAVRYGTPSAPPVTITGINYQPGVGIALTWANCFPGHNYQVLYKDQVPTGTWTNVGSPVTATNTAASFTDTRLPLAAKRFYKVQTQ